MSFIDSEKFEALWKDAQNLPVFRKADTKPVQPDLSLTGILSQYLGMVTRFHNKGRISQADLDDLTTAVNALKAILVRIKDADLVAEEMSQNIEAAQRRIREKAT